MRDTDPVTAEQILARGAANGSALEDFGPVWNSARLKLAHASWAGSGLEPFLSSEVPYAGTSSGRLSEDAVDVFLATAASDGPLRILELGSGTGVFARLFLDRLRDIAPKVYARTVYVATDMSKSVLAEREEYAILDGHEGHVESRQLDAGRDWQEPGSIDAVFGTYILDSLPFDLLSVKDDQTWRKEVRTVIGDEDGAYKDELRRVLDTGDAGQLAEWSWIGPRLGLQARHVPVERSSLVHESSLPRSTGGNMLPFVHCHGALDCLDNCRRVLRPGGVAVFTDYGHQELFSRHEFLEFQAFGASVAAGINFPQLAAASEDWDDAIFFGPDEEDGNLFTRVLYKPGPQDVADRLPGLVNRLYGAETFRRNNELLEKARGVMKSRFHETARMLYREALAGQPRNWVLIEEIASTLMMVMGEHEEIVEIVDLGLASNPLAPGLWLAKGEALVALERYDEARAALSHLAKIAPSIPAVWRVLARLESCERRFGAALDAVAEGLKHDKSCDEQEELLQIQQNVLAEMARQEHRILMAGANQFRALDSLPE